MAAFATILSETIITIFFVFVFADINLIKKYNYLIIVVICIQGNN